MHLCQKQENSYNKLTISTNQHPQITLYKVKKPHKIHKDLKFKDKGGAIISPLLKLWKCQWSYLYFVHEVHTLILLLAYRRHLGEPCRTSLPPISAAQYFFFLTSINFLCYIRSLFKRLNYSKTINKNITQTVVCHTNDVTQLFFGRWQLDASFHVAALRYSRAISPRLIEFSCVTQSSEHTANLIQVRKNSRA